MIERQQNGNRSLRNAVWTTGWIVFIGLLIQGCAVQSTRTPEAQIRTLVERFVAAVNAADSAAFLSFFDPNATAFFPSSAARKVGIEQIRAAIEPAFAQGPRTQPVLANDLRLTFNGDLAIASFDAGIEKMHARRTLIFSKRGGEWKIIHLHASNLVDQ